LQASLKSIWACRTAACKKGDEAVEGKLEQIRILEMKLPWMEHEEKHEESRVAYTQSKEALVIQVRQNLPADPVVQELKRRATALKLAARAKMAQARAAIGGEYQPGDFLMDVWQGCPVSPSEIRASIAQLKAQLPSAVGQSRTNPILLP